jgi:hypothetical protein
MKYEAVHLVLAALSPPWAYLDSPPAEKKKRGACSLQTILKDELIPPYGSRRQQRKGLHCKNTTNTIP